MIQESELTFSAKWNYRFMAIAQDLAKWSKDHSTGVGCIIVGPDKEIRSGGYNGFPRGVNDEIAERYERPLKYAFTEHAERNAIYNATLYNASLRGCVMYVTLPSCPDCARSIIQTGIKEVIAMAAPNTRANNIPGWRDMIGISTQMFHEAGVKYYEMPNPINMQNNNVDALFNISGIAKIISSATANQEKDFLPYLIKYSSIQAITSLIIESQQDKPSDQIISQLSNAVIGINSIGDLYNISPQIHAHASTVQDMYPRTSDRIIALMQWQQELIRQENTHISGDKSPLITATGNAQAALTRQIVEGQYVDAVTQNVNQILYSYRQKIK